MEVEPHEELIEINPADFLTVGTVGPPGQRVFYLQGGARDEIYSIIIEKESADALADGLERLLKDNSLPTEVATERGTLVDMRLRKPVQEEFRAARIGFWFSGESQKLTVLVSDQPDADEAGGRHILFWISANQTRRLVTRAREVVAAGRPVCGNCGRPIDAEGHFCPKRNGHPTSQ